MGAELAEERLVGRAAGARLRHEQAGAGRDDEGGDLRHEPVADRQQRVGLRRGREGQILLRDADDDAGDDVDEGDDEAGDRVAANEFRGAVHGAVEIAFVLEIAPALPRLRLVDEAGREIGVDRHLLARHAVQAEARGDFGDASRTLGDDDEIHHDEDREHDHADDEIAAHHEIAEGLDDVAGGGRALVPMAQDETRRGEVEREAQHRRHQQHGRERGEFERPLDEQRHHQDEDGEGDGERQADIEQPGRHRQDEHGQDGDDRQRERDFAAPERRAQAREERAGRHGESGCVCHRRGSGAGARADLRPRPVPARRGAARSSLPAGRAAACCGASGSRCPARSPHGCGCRGSDGACRG